MRRIQQQLPSEDRAEKQPATASAKPADATQPRPEKPEPKNIARGIGQAKKGKARYKCAVCLFRVGVGIKSVSKQLRISPKKAIFIRNDAGIPPLKWRMQPGCKPRKGERAKLYEEPKKGPIYWYVPTEEEKRQRHKEKKRKALEDYYADHEERKRAAREYAQKHWEKNRTNGSFRMVKSLRQQIWKFAKGIRYSKHLMQCVGCTKEELKAHIERQFVEGMSWDNYGEWHIDHIRPCASFDLSKPESLKECFNFSNLQPLWASDNISKGSAWEGRKHYHRR